MSMGDEEIKIWLDEYAKTMNDDTFGIGNITIDLGDYYSVADDTITLTGLEMNNTHASYDDWIINSVFDKNTHDNIKLTGGGEEMLRVEKDGFYVRGVKVEADAKEAEQVYKAFKEWLTWANLSRNDEE